MVVVAEAVAGCALPVVGFEYINFINKMRSLKELLLNKNELTNLIK